MTHSDIKTSVLLVEDQPIILENIRHVLEDESFVVYTAGSAREACAVLDKHGDHITAAFVDIDLGQGEDGFCVARYARALSPQMCVLYTSGGVRGGLTDERVSDSRFVAKPYRPSQIGAMLKDMLLPAA